MGPGAWVPESPLLALAASVLLFLGYVLSASLWGRIVADLGGPTLPVGASVQLFMIANLGRYVPGKVWQIAGLAALARGRGVPAATATAAAVLGQGIALGAATMVGLTALLQGGEVMRRWGMVAAVIVSVGVVLAAIPAFFRKVASLWFRVARQEVPEGLGSVHGVQWVAMYVLNWALYAFSFWMLVASFGYPADVLPVASAFAAAYVLGYLAIFAPAGIGVREGFLIALLTPHLGLGPSGAVAVIARVWTTLVEVIPAGIFWLRHVGTGGGSINASENDGE